MGALVVLSAPRELSRAPSVSGDPIYNLPHAHRALKQLGVLEGAEVSTLPQTLKRIFAPRAAAPVTSAA